MTKPLQILRELKSVTFASVEGGQPRARIIDVMLVEDDKLYFLTARGKPFYRQLLETPYVAITGMTETYYTVRVWGQVAPVEPVWLDRIFEANPMMNDLYPGEKRDILTPFCLAVGEGETFDLSDTPPVRAQFSFGGAPITPAGYRITDDCEACGICAESCPVDCIDAGPIYTIRQENCLHCGRCVEVCPAEAIVPAGRLAG